MNDAVVIRGNAPLGQRNYAFYVRLVNLINHAYETILTRAWLNSKHFINHDYRIYLEDTDVFWDRWCQAISGHEDEPQEDLWYNLPTIAAALIELLKVYKPGWNNRTSFEVQARQRDDLLKEANALIHDMGQVQ